MKIIGGEVDLISLYPDQRDMLFEIISILDHSMRRQVEGKVDTTDTYDYQITIRGDMVYLSQGVKDG